MLAAGSRVGVRLVARAKCDHDYADISNGTTLINVSKCRRCGGIAPTVKYRTTIADFAAARKAQPEPDGGGRG